MTAGQQKRYTAAPNAPFPKAMAPVVGERLDRIADRRGGLLLPEDVVTDAADAASPIHDLFEWDDTRAAHQHRLATARRIIGCVRVIVTADDTSVPVRQYHNVVITPPAAREPSAREGASEDASEDVSGRVRCYVPVERVEADADLRKQVLGDVIGAAEYFVRKYRDILRTCGVVEDMEKILSRLRLEAA